MALARRLVGGGLLTLRLFGDPDQVTVTVRGTSLTATAAVGRTPLSWGKGLVLIALLMIAGPVVSHTLGSAAYRIGIPLKQAVRDDLSTRQTETVAVDAETRREG